MSGLSFDATQTQEASARQRQQKARRQGAKIEEQEWSIWKHGDGPDGDLRPELRQLGLEVRGVRASRRDRPRVARGKFHTWHNGDPHEELGAELLASIEPRESLRPPVRRAENHSDLERDLGSASWEGPTQSQGSRRLFASLCWFCRLCRDDDESCSTEGTACDAHAGEAPKKNTSAAEAQADEMSAAGPGVHADAESLPYLLGSAMPGVIEKE